MPQQQGTPQTFKFNSHLTLSLSHFAVRSQRLKNKLHRTEVNLRKKILNILIGDAHMNLKATQCNIARTLKSFNRSVPRNVIEIILQRESRYIETS